VGHERSLPGGTGIQQLGLEGVGLVELPVSMEEDEVDQVQRPSVSSDAARTRARSTRGPVPPVSPTTSWAMSARVLGKSIDGLPSYHPMYRRITSRTAKAVHP